MPAPTLHLPAGRLPPRWYHWRWILPGLAWGSQRPPQPGLHDCSPGRERAGVGCWGMGWGSPKQEKGVPKEDRCLSMRSSTLEPLLSTQGPSA